MAEDSRRTVNIVSPVMAKNNEIAGQNRRRLRAAGILAFNLIGSPGCGKTTLLERLASILGRSMVVVEGDVSTRRDAERIERAGCPAFQVETQGACHLDAQRVGEALDHLAPDLGPCHFLAIENVGNLICPSAYDLGENLRVGLLSAPEGDDKVLKYPALFSRIDALVVSKVDLLPHLEFDVERVKSECRSLRTQFASFELSGKTGQGVEGFAEFLRETREKLLAEV